MPRNTTAQFPIKRILPGSKDFPKALKEIHDAPKELYCRGNLELLKTPCFGVVGTRKLTNYGREAVQKIVYPLAQHFTIVSGLALGIDALSHQITLDADGKTIAVLGSGVDDACIYPTTNQRLAKDILDNGGLIISEYPPGTHATEFTFPQRNRIISGLSNGLLVVEAAKSSGSLITAKCAVDQNRDVYAVPGSIFSVFSAGTNDLIKKGAKPVLSVNDILEEYSDISTPGSENSAILRGAAEPHAEFLLPGTKNPIEKKILAILSQGTSLTLDEIIRDSEMEASAILSTISILEIKGMIKNNNGNFSIK